MDIDALKGRIRRGRLEADDLPLVFDESNELDETLRLRAVAVIMRMDPGSARPWVTRVNADRLAEEIEQHNTDPELISLAVRAFPSSQRLRTAALKNPLTPTQALLIAAGKSTEEELVPLLRDESRLILSPDVLSVLSNREDIDPLVRDRLTQLYTQVKRDKNFQIRAGFRPEELSEEDRRMLISEAEIEDEEESVKKNIYAKLLTMTPAEKALLALRANRMTRMLLVKDPNKLVCKAVMRSPRLNEQDVEAIARTREVSDEVLRIIQQNRRWMRKYAIMRNLALNPRTPITIALGLIGRLNNSDIKAALRDHNLPNAVKSAIKRLARTRGLK